MALSTMKTFTRVAVAAVTVAVSVTALPVVVVMVAAPGVAEPIGPAPVEGRWWCPVAGPVSFTDTWGAPRSGGRHHQGVDMFAPPGTPVIAPVAGRVEFRADGLGGLTVRLWTTDGDFVYGAHLDRYGPLDGLVDASTVIGYVGTTGNAAGTPSHLHLEIHLGRQPGDPPAPVNPTPLVTAACATTRLRVVADPARPDAP